MEHHVYHCGCLCATKWRGEGAISWVGLRPAGATRRFGTISNPRTSTGSSGSAMHTLPCDRPRSSRLAVNAHSFLDIDCVDVYFPFALRSIGKWEIHFARARPLADPATPGRHQSTRFCRPAPSMLWHVAPVERKFD